MKFNTQVCTTREQSERLLALGLKQKTADMYLTRCFVGNNGAPMIFVGTTHKPSTVLFSKEDIPAWSLHRLIAMLPKTYRDNFYLQICGSDIHYRLNGSVEYGIINFNKENLYENIIDCIEWLIKNNYFNKQYLNESL